jgi:hypothetical protein
MHRMITGISRLAAGVMVLAVATTAATALQPPDFSGQWVVPPLTVPLSTGGSPNRPDHGQLAIGDMGSGWGSPITIVQDGMQLVVTQTLFSSYDAQVQPRFRYSLDGSETSNTVMLGHTAQVRRSRAAWDGQVLRITTQYPGIDPASGQPLTTEVTHRLRLEAPATMIIEVTRSAPLGGQPTTTRTVYRKR